MNLNLGQSVAVAFNIGGKPLMLVNLCAVNKPKPEYFNDVFLSEMTKWGETIPNYSLYAVLHSSKR